MNDIKKAFDVITQIMNIEFNLLGYDMSFGILILYIIFAGLILFVIGGLLR